MTALPVNLTLEEVGILLRRSAKTIARWIEEGLYFREGEIIKFNDGSKLIPRVEVERVIEYLKKRPLDEAAPASVAPKRKSRGKGFVNNY